MLTQIPCYIWIVWYKKTTSAIIHEGKIYNDIKTSWIGFFGRGGEIYPLLLIISSLLYNELAQWYKGWACTVVQKMGVKGKFIALEIFIRNEYNNNSLIEMHGLTNWQVLHVLDARSLRMKAVEHALCETMILTNVHIMLAVCLFELFNVFSHVH